MAGTEKDFKVKKGLIVSEGITLGGHTFDDIDIGTEFVDTDDHIMSSGAIKEKIESYSYTTNTGDVTLTGTQTLTNKIIRADDGTDSAPSLSFDADTDTGFYRPASNQIAVVANGARQLLFKDGSVEPYLDSDVNFGTSSFRFKNGYWDLIDTLNFKVNGGQGSDGQVLTSTGSGVAWEDAASGGIASLAEDSTPQLGGDLDTNGSEIVSTSNQHISITPNGTGDIQLNADTIRVGDSNADVTIAPNISSTTAKLQFQSDGDVLLRTASGDASMYLNANTLIAMQAATFRFGTNGGNPTLTTLGTSDLTLNTNSGTNSGSIVIADGVDGQISITPNGAGTIKLDGVELDNSAIATGYVLKATSATAAGWAAESGGGVTSLPDLSDVALVSNSLVAGTPSASMSGSQFNTGFGRGTLGLLSSGDNNSAIGFNALGGLNTGSNNTANGYNAGATINSGSRNTVIGYGAGDGFDTENDNIAIGYDALGGAVAGGEQNVVIGNYAGDAITSADGSTLVGHKAGTALTTGWGTTLIGFEAGAESTGSRNTFMGYRAGHYYTSGNDNIALGYQALHGSFGNSAGSNNISIGKSSSFNITTGGSNIAIGDNAGNNITTGSNNVVIGEADVPSATGNSQLSISDGVGGVTWIQGNADGIVLGALTPLFFERSALDTTAVDFRVPTVQSSTANPNSYPMPFAGKVLAASFLFTGGTVSGTATNTIRVRKNGGSTGTDIEEFTFVPGDLNNPAGTNYTLVKTGLSFAFSAGDILQVRRQSGSTDLNNAQALLWVSYNF